MSNAEVKWFVLIDGQLVPYDAALTRYNTVAHLKTIPGNEKIDELMPPSAYEPKDSSQESGDYFTGLWMQTFTGRKIYPEMPEHPGNEIVIEDIAHALAHICRYGGHAARFYSVAEHSVLVSRYCPPEFKLDGLLHDATEAYLGDIIAPIKRNPKFAHYKELELRWSARIAKTFGTNPVEPAAVKQIDLAILHDERRALRTMPPQDWWGTENGLHCEISCLDPQGAKGVFLNTFDELTK